MAIPANLWLVSTRLTYRMGGPADPDHDEVRTTVWVTYHVATNPAGPGGAVADDLSLWQNILWSDPGAPLSLFCVLEDVTTLHMQTETEAVDDWSQNIGNTVAKPLPPQCAMLVVGRAKEIGHQCRRWLPCLSIESMDADGLIPQGTLDGWGRAHFLPVTIGTTEITPVIWDATNEVVRQVDSLRGSREYRTIRGRALRTSDAIVDLPPL